MLPNQCETQMLGFSKLILDIVPLSLVTYTCSLVLTIPQGPFKALVAQNMLVVCINTIINNS
jgi:hypothetical protein